MELDISEERLAGTINRYNFPRRVQSEGEKKAARMCAEDFRERGFDPISEPFRYPTFITYLVVLIPLWACISFALSYILVGVVPVVKPAWLVSGIFLGVAGFFALVGSRFTSRVRPLNAESVNVYAKLPPKISPPRGLIVVSAHYDSKSQRVPIRVRSWALRNFVRLSLLLLVLVPLLATFYLFTIPGIEYVEIVLRIALIPMIGVMGILAVNTSGNISPGAIDNASGMAVVFELARWYANHPPSNYEIWFVQFGAEELYRMGSRQFVRAHALEFEEFPACFNINFDLLGNEVQYMKREGWRQKLVSEVLLPLCEESIAELEIEAKGISIRTHNTTDRIIFSKQGFETLDFTDWSTGEFVHTSEDKPTRVDPKILAQNCRIARAILLKIGV